MKIIVLTEYSDTKMGHHDAKSINRYSSATVQSQINVGPLAHFELSFVMGNASKIMPGADTHVQLLQPSKYKMCWIEIKHELYILKVISTH